MVDLDDFICGTGGVDNRGMDAVRVLKEKNLRSGRFDQNGVSITVFQGSTVRELEYQYNWRLLMRRTGD